MTDRYEATIHGRYFDGDTAQALIELAQENEHLRAQMQAVEALAVENEAWYASDRKTISTRELRAALAVVAGVPVDAKEQK